MKKLQEQVFELVERMFKECDPELKQYTHRDRSYIKISAPQIFIDLLTEGYKNAFGTWLPKSPEGKLYFRDIEVIPNYEMEVVLFHKNYPEIQDKRLIYKVKLNSGKNIRTGEFNKISLSKDEEGNLTATSFFDKKDKKTDEIQIIKELVSAIRFVSPRSNALNEAYHKAKKFLDQQVPERPDIPPSEPTKLQ